MCVCCFSLDFSGILSKDGDTRHEVDLLLSTLETSEPNCSSEQPRSLQPCSTAQQTEQNSTDDEMCRETLHSSEPSCTSDEPSSQESRLVAGATSRNDTEEQFLSVSKYRDSVMSCVKSDQMSVPVGGTHPVLECSDASRNNPACDAVPSTCSLSTQLDVDRSISMTSVLSTSTPLEVDESTATRTVPLSSAYVVNMEQQFVDEDTSPTHG